MQRHTHHLTPRIGRIATGVASLGFVILVGCGGSDAAPTASSAVEPAGLQVDNTESDPGNVAGDLGNGETVRDQLTGAMGEQGDTINDAIGSLSAGSRFSIVADQLNAEVEVDGSMIRLLFDEGSAGDATFDCMVAGSFVEDGETLVLIYPDGESSC